MKFEMAHFPFSFHMTIPHPARYRAQFWWILLHTNPASFLCEILDPENTLQNPDSFAKTFKFEPEDFNTSHMILNSCWRRIRSTWSTEIPSAHRPQSLDGSAETAAVTWCSGFPWHKNKMAARSGISAGAKGRLIAVIGDEVSCFKSINTTLHDH